MKKISLHKIILIAVIASIIQVFLEEFSRYEQWSVLARNILIISGLLFDLFFSAEFTAKVIIAIKKKEAGKYWKYEGGWVDFLSSYPLLILNLSAVYLVFAGIPEGEASALYGVSMFIRDTKIARVLRFIRIVKIFGKIGKTGSGMTDRHITIISRTTAAAIIFSFILFSFFASPEKRKITERSQWFDDSISTVVFLQIKTGVSDREIVKKVFSKNKYLLKLLHKEEELISAISDENFKKYFSDKDYSSVNNRGFRVYFSVADINRETAYRNLIVFFIIILTSFSIMFFYKPHFVSTISDTVNLMNQGFRNKLFNDQIKIRAEFENDEITILAKFYNSLYLPAKLKRISKEDSETRTDPK